MATHMLMPQGSLQQQQEKQQQSLLRRAQLGAAGVRGAASGQGLWAPARSTSTTSAGTGVFNLTGGGKGSQLLSTGSVVAGEDASWEVRAFAEDAASCSGQWPPRSYACSFCQREFRTAQALGGHMNVHRRERAQANQIALLRNNAQQAAAASVTAAQWCGFSTSPSTPSVSSPAIAKSESGGAALVYSNLSPGGALVTMAPGGILSPAESSQITSRSPNIRYSSDGASKLGCVNSNSTIMFGASQLYPTSSPISSPISNSTRSSDSSVVTKGAQAGGGYLQSVSSPMPSSNSNSLGTFVPFHHSNGRLLFSDGSFVAQELIPCVPQLHKPSFLISNSMIIDTGDDHNLDLELRLGPSMMCTT